MALEIARITVMALGYFIIAVSLIPLIRNDNWVFRIFEYPRAQKLIINLVLLAAFIPFSDWNDSHHIIFSVLMAANACYLFYQIFPYTKLATRQLKQANVPGKDKHFKLLVCNVYQDNRDASRCLQYILKYSPDIVLLVETDEWWRSQLSSLEREYPYLVMKPLDNTYGMILYSKLELINPQVKYLVEEGIPSIHTKVKLLSGDIFHLYCVHPQPPVPQENPRSTERDAELLMVAKQAKSCNLPVVVAGDLNDVAWSYTTELFMKVSGLLDPRRGRGFFNTFHAKYWFFRWPLDHIFCSKHFQLVDLQRLPQVGSDHFPMYVELGMDYNKAEENKEEQMHADAEEVEVAEEKIEKAR